jgi:hypothetical protein
MASKGRSHRPGRPGKAIGIILVLVLVITLEYPPSRLPGERAGRRRPISGPRRVTAIPDLAGPTGFLGPFQTSGLAPGRGSVAGRQ